jgi:hypothetical protein
MRIQAILSMASTRAMQAIEMFGTATSDDVVRSVFTLLIRLGDMILRVDLEAEVAD